MALNSEGKKRLAEITQRQAYEEQIERNKLHLAEKNVFKNLERCIHIQRTEQETADRIQELKEREAFAEQRVARTEALAMELDKLKRNEIRELKLRQSLRVNCPELRQLESKLRTAYVTKELVAQVTEKRAKKLEEKIRHKEEQQKLEEARINQAEIIRLAAEEDLIKKAQYRHDLQDQMIINEKRKRYLYEEFLRDKKMIDDIVLRIHAEDEREREEKMCKMQRTKEQMDAFREAQMIWKRRQMKEIEEENERIEEYVMKRAIEMQEREKKRKELKQLKEETTARIRQRLHEHQMQIKEREDLTLELYQEEKKHEEELRHKAGIEKALRLRIEVRKSLKQQMLEKEEKLKEEAAADAKYKEELMLKLAEEKKLEQLGNERRRLKMLECRREVEAAMIARRQKRAEEMQILLEMKKQEEAQADERKRIIEEERMRLLKEHAKNLIGYLPKGVLREDDLQHLGSDILGDKTC